MAAQRFVWQCLACSASNPEAVKSCVICGFPADAPAWRVLEAREAIESGRDPIAHDPASRWKVWAETAGNGPVFLVLAFFGVLLIVAGSTLFRVWLSWSGIFAGIALCVIGSLVFMPRRSRHRFAKGGAADEPGSKSICRAAKQHILLRCVDG